MVFSSYLFLFFFLPLALLTYYAAPRGWRHLVLTLSSYVFYGWANPWFVLLMLFSTVVDYCAGLVISKQWGHFGEDIQYLEKGGPRSTAQKAALATSISVNLCLLGFFKYFNFGIENYNAIVQQMGISEAQFEGFFRVILPLGISFYTFQTMSYAIDVYRGDAKAIRNFVDFSCFVAMFPQLVAGPIIRFQDIADQLACRTHTYEKFSRGVAFFCLGMGKKVLLANPCGKVADLVFNSGGPDAFDAWYGIVAYAFQIYFDFSGYTDMAIGLGLMFGFMFPKNFDSPYHSKSITEFWRRWHLSLSVWLRDNLYIPLGGNRISERRTYINLAAVMLLGGLWHGASWNFLIWGGIHGCWLGVERKMGKESFYSRLPGPVQMLITFVIVLFAWVFFRAETLPQAWNYIRSMLALATPQAGSRLADAVIYNPYYLLAMAMAAVVVWGCPQTWDLTRKLTWPKALFAYGVFALSLLALTTQSYNPFIYFFF